MNQPIFPQIEDPYGLLLDPQVVEIVKTMFVTHRRVVIHKELGGGFSGSHVYWVTPVPIDETSKIPVVVKTGPVSAMQEEWLAYQEHIRDRLHGISDIQGDMVSLPGNAWGGLRYGLAGGGVFEVESFYHFFPHSDTRAILDLWEHQLFKVLKSLWIYQNSAVEFPLQASYEFLLPVNLVIQPAPLPSGVLSHSIRADRRARPILKVGDYVSVEGFEVVEIDPRQRTVMLNVPFHAGASKDSFRLRLQAVDEIESYPIGIEIAKLSGVVSQTRSDLLQAQIQRAIGMSLDLAAGTLTLPDGLRLPNPLAVLARLPGFFRHVKIARIHGDLNLENILVAHHGNNLSISLIDFATARQDHILHDFLRLETEIVTRVIPAACVEAGIKADNLPEVIHDFYLEARKSTLQTQRDAPSLAYAAFAKPFAMLMLLRKTASDYLVDSQDWSEYYQGLVIYLLGALKLKSLDQPPAAPWAKPAAFWAAAVVYGFLEPVTEKNAPTTMDWELARRYLPDAGYAIKDLASGLNALNHLLRNVITYLPRSLALDLLQSPTAAEQGHFLEGTLLFTHLAGFTALAEKLKTQDRLAGPEILVEWINRYLDQMLSILFRYQGVLIQFNGEAMVCLFAETGRAQAALNAVRAACEMKQAWQETQGAIQISQKIMPLSMKAGSHSGQLFLARVGSLDQMEYILTGSAAARAAQAEASAAQGEILLSQETYHLIQEHIEAEAICGKTGLYCLKEMHPFSSPGADPWNEIEKLLAGFSDDLGALAERLNAFTPYLPAGVLPYLVHESPEMEGQYRQVTILFVNFIGMSKIMNAHGVNAAAIVADLSQYIRAVHEEVQYYGGVIYKASLCEQGDQFMVVFGAPTAHEKDTRRAALTALALQRKIKQLPSPTARLLLSQRMGIHAGTVFAGKIGSPAQHQCEYMVIGEDVNLAKWLMTNALPGQIWVSPQVRERIQEDCELESLPPVKNDANGLIPVFRLQKARAISSAQRASQLLRSESVGRTSELQQLINRFNDLVARAGKQIIAIIGEAGVGKTRLVSEWQQACEKTGCVFTRLTGSGRAYGQIPYGIFVEIFEQFFGFTPNDSPQACWDKLSERIQAISDQSRPGWSDEFTDQLAYLGQFLALDLTLQEGLSERIRPLSAEALHLQTRLTLRACLENAAQEQALLLVLEDLHWADDKSLDLLLFLLAQLSDELPVLFCLIYRDQKERTIWKTWQEIERTHPDCLAISLKELESADGRRLLSNLLHNDQLPEYFQALVFKQTDGNPLYIEEVVLSLIRQNGLVRTTQGSWEVAYAIEQIEIPDQLQQIIQSRIDELDFSSPGARRVLWMAAVIGDEFSRDTLQALFAREGRPMRELEDNLRVLRNAAMIQAVSHRETRQLGVYRFRHGLVRQVAYENILVRKRREYHCAIANSLGNRHSQDLYRYYHALARHYDQGEQWGKAFEYHLLAGQRDAQAYANAEADRHLRRAIAIAPLAAPDQENLAQAYFAAGKVSSALDEFDTAIAFLEQADQIWANAPDGSAALRRARVCYEIGRIYEQRGGRENWERALAWKEKGLAGLPHDRPSAESALLHVLAGIVATRQKNLPLAIREGEQALAHAQSAGSQSEIAAAYRMLSVTWRYQQHPERAMEYCQKAIELDVALADLPAQAKGYANQGVIAWDMGNWLIAKEASLKAVAVWERIGSPYRLAMNCCNLADTCRGLGELDMALSYASRGLQLFEKIASPQGMIFAQAVLGPILWRRGDFEPASACLLEARRLIAVHQAPEFAISVGRWLAQVYVSQGQLEQAEAEVQTLLAAPTELNGEAEPVQRLRGQIMAARGQWQEATQVLQSSLERLEAEGERYEIGITLLAYASVLAQIKCPAAARTFAEQARMIFIRLGAQADLWDVETFMGRLDRDMPPPL